MHGAMHGLAESLDADSAYLTPDAGEAAQAGAEPGPADVGLELTRQYYLRVVAARDGSPAARAGLRPGDFVRVDRPTGRRARCRCGRACGCCAARPGSTVTLTVIRGNAAEPHVVELTREVPRRAAAVDADRPAGDRATSASPEFADGTPAALRAGRRRGCSTTAREALVIDLRGAARGPLDGGHRAARALCRVRHAGHPGGRAGARARRSAPRRVTARSRCRWRVLTDFGTAGAAELFAAALTGNKRAETVGERTTGRAAHPEAVRRCPTAARLWMSYAWYLTPAGDRDPRAGPAAGCRRGAAGRRVRRARRRPGDRDPRARRSNA